MPVEDGEWDTGFQETEPSDLADAIPSGPESVEDDSTLDDTEPQGDPQVPDDGPPPEFDPRSKRDFEGLLYLGYLTDTFTVYGHSFVIHTLNTGEVLRVGQVHAEYANLISDMKAYQAAVISACITSVDGKSLPEPLSMRDDPLERARLRFQHVIEWFPPVLDAIYERYILLERKVDDLLDQMVKASG